jgi:mannose-6-phosphate isomerase-like protein (cupin superfamily)
VPRSRRDTDSAAEAYAEWGANFTPAKLGLAAALRRRAWPAYTVVNLKTVEDQAPKFGFAPHLQSRFARKALGLERSGITTSPSRPTSACPSATDHAEQEEVYVVVAGSARMKLDDEELELGTWDAIRVAPTVTRGMQAGPRAPRSWPSALRADDSPDVEVVRDFWPQ